MKLFVFIRLNNFMLENSEDYNMVETSSLIEEMDAIQDYINETDYLEIAKKGFLLPLIALLESILFYTFTPMINALNNLLESNGHSIVIPGYTSLISSFAIVVFAMTALGYFENFRDGANYPKKALVYGVCAILGLVFFWTVLSNVNPKSLSTDAITSAIIEIILTLAGALLSYRYFRRSSDFQQI